MLQCTAHQDIMSELDIPGHLTGGLSTTDTVTIFQDGNDCTMFGKESNIIIPGYAAFNGFYSIDQCN